MTRRIVVGYDGTAATLRAVDRAIEMTRDGHRWEIVLVCTHDRPADFRNQSLRWFHPPFVREVPPQAWIDEWSARTMADMKHAVLRVRMAGADASATCTLDDPAELIARVAQDLDARCVVVADDQVGIVRDLVLGSVTKRVLRLCQVPVVVVPAERERRSA